MTNTAQTTKRGTAFCWLVAGLLLGWLAATVQPSPTASADERRTKPKPPTAFKSGGEVSAEILERISKQITSIDQRLARIETAVTGKKK